MRLKRYKNCGTIPFLFIAVFISTINHGAVLSKRSDRSQSIKRICVADHQPPNQSHLPLFLPLFGFSPVCAFSNAKSHVFFRHTWNYLELKQFCKKRVIYVDGFHFDDTGVVDAHPGCLSLVYWHGEIYQRPTIWIGFKEVISRVYNFMMIGQYV